MAATLGAFLAEAAAALAAAGFDEPRRRARRLLGGVLGLSAAELLSDPGRPLRCGDADLLRRALARVLQGEPTSRIIERREFWGLNFTLSADTLDPRPETETLVESALARITDRTAKHCFLDLGTGTGCVLLALLSECPAAEGVGIDITARAVRTARNNAVALGLSDRARFFVGDWNKAVAARFTTVVANPPYIATGALAELPPEVARYDPQRALDGGPDGLAAYRCIAPELPALLAPGGFAAIEVGAGQAAAVTALFAPHGLAIDAIERDLAGVERCIVVRSCRGEGGSRDPKKSWNVSRSRLG